MIANHQGRRYSHRVIHALSVGADLLILQARLHQVQWEHAWHADDAGDASVDDFWHQSTRRDGILDYFLFVGHLNFKETHTWPSRSDKKYSNRVKPIYGANRTRTKNYSRPADTRLIYFLTDCSLIVEFIKTNFKVCCSKISKLFCKLFFLVAWAST